MKVHFDFTIDDMVDVTERATGRSPLIRSWRWRSTAIACAVSALAVYLLSPGSEGFRLFAACIAIGLGMTFFPANLERARRSRLRRFLRERLGSDGPFRCEVELKPEGVAVSQAGTQSLREWSTIVSIEDGPEAVEIVPRSAGSLVVRNRAFSSPAERTEFIRLARSYIAGKAPSAPR
jgi:hypothetical protein